MALNGRNVLKLTCTSVTKLSYYGYHITEVPHQTLQQKVTANKWSIGMQLIYHPMMSAIRASIIMFLFRIQDKRRHILIALHSVFWINVGYFIGTTTANVLQCTPVRYSYDKPIMDTYGPDGKTVAKAGGHCINSWVFVLSSLTLSIFMDLIIIPIPTAMVWNLQMPRKTKMAVVVIMSLGWV
jgi:hypothetical protein